MCAEDNVQVCQPTTPAQMFHLLRRQVLRRWPLVLSGTAVQYLTMPTLAYCFAHVWGLSGDYLIGLLLVGCVPGAMASNVLTFNARGNTSYSVSLTTTATLLSPLAVPIKAPAPKPKAMRVLKSIFRNFLVRRPAATTRSRRRSRRWSS